MELIELEKIRNQICAELSSDSKPNRDFLLAYIGQIPIRDGLLRYLYDHAEVRDQVAKNLNELLQQDCAQEQAAIATALAGCYWLDANLNKTRDALDMALAADPSYSLARLLDVALIHGVPATVWADSLAAVSPEQCLTGAT